MRSMALATVVAGGPLAAQARPGAELVSGEGGSKGLGYFTSLLLANARPSMSIVREEIFGLALYAARFGDAEIPNLAAVEPGDFAASARPGSATHSGGSRWRSLQRWKSVGIRLDSNYVQY
ncbi:hypothetical protein B5V02_09115 [Mesorhizobium kowhaii]|uniref:Uncharacterized protein n=2 Tax=Mesorhizobium kowhaii TaxID=1300272 RepID=A0A2W7C7D6_9HYPH|nr:hypothetical protein B5V02_09115 [Mesorhizobium kowhaii]